MLKKSCKKWTKNLVKNDQGAFSMFQALTWSTSQWLQCPRLLLYVSPSMRIQIIISLYHYIRWTFNQDTNDYIYNYIIIFIRHAQSSIRIQMICLKYKNLVLPTLAILEADFFVITLRQKVFIVILLHIYINPSSYYHHPETLFPHSSFHQIFNITMSSY